MFIHVLFHPIEHVTHLRCWYEEIIHFLLNYSSVNQTMIVSIHYTQQASYILCLDKLTKSFDSFNGLISFISSSYDKIYIILIGLKFHQISSLDIFICYFHSSFFSFKYVLWIHSPLLGSLMSCTFFIYQWWILAIHDRPTYLGRKKRQKINKNSIDLNRDIKLTKCTISFKKQ